MIKLNKLIWGELDEGSNLKQHTTVEKRHRADKAATRMAVEGGAKQEAPLGVSAAFFRHFLSTHASALKGEPTTSEVVR